MVRFELRGETPTAEGGTMFWHIARPGSALTLCSRVAQLTDTVLSISVAGSIPEDTRCPVCWTGGMPGTAAARGRRPQCCAAGQGEP